MLPSTFTAIKVELHSCVKHCIRRYLFQWNLFISSSVEFLQIRDDLSPQSRRHHLFTAPYHSCSIPGLLQPILQFTQGFQVKIFLLLFLHQLLGPLPPVLAAPINTDISAGAQNLQHQGNSSCQSHGCQGHLEGVTAVAPGNRNYSATSHLWYLSISARKKRTHG